MPGRDDTLTAGGPAQDPLDELCTCGHTRGEHHTLDEACTDPDCECCAFQAVNEFGNSAPSTETLRARLAALEELERDLADGGEVPTGEGLERLVEKHRQLGTEPHGSDEKDPEALMREFVSRGQKAQSVADAIIEAHAQAQADDVDKRMQELDPDKMHGAGGEFGGTDEGSHLHIPPRTAQEQRDHDAEFVHEWPIDPEAIRRATREPEGIKIGNEVNPFRTTKCAQCKHDKVDHDHSEPHECLAPDCTCRAYVEYTSPELDPKRVHAAFMDGPGTYVPPLLRRRLVPIDELPELLGLKPGDPLFEQLQEIKVDPVPISIGSESPHWRQIERIAGRVSPEPAGTEAPIINTYKALALCLLDLRGRLGSVPTVEHLDLIATSINRNAKAIEATGRAIESVSDSLTRNSG